jgi:hypothetical protein
MPLKNNIYTMSELKNRDKEIIENDDNPIWIRVQSALKNEGAFSLFPGTPDYSESHNKIYGSRSARSRFNNLRTDKILYRNYVLSTNNLLSESVTNDLVDSQTDILFLRMRTPELDEICWNWSQVLLSERDYMRSAGIDLPVENDNRKIIKAEMMVRSSYLHKIWHNSLYAMSELGMEIPNWCKILPYHPLVNAFHGTNRDDEDIGERLLSILEEKYPELHAELIASNPFHSPLIGFTPGKGHRRGTKFPSISEIISRIESGESVNQDWENILLGHLPLSEIAEDSDEIEDNDEVEEDDESTEDFYLLLTSSQKNEYMTNLRIWADNDEITGAWSMNREKLISAWATRTEKMASEMKKLGRVYPTIPRLTDWTIFVMENVNIFKR